MPPTITKKHKGVSRYCSCAKCKKKDPDTNYKGNAYVGKGEPKRASLPSKTLVHDNASGDTLVGDYGPSSRFTFFGHGFGKESVSVFCSVPALVARPTPFF